MISVIVATWNSEKTLDACLHSIASQQDAEFEVLLSDGGSTDATLEIARRHGSVIAELRSGPDAGVYDAWNRVIPKARGEWLMFLGADDILLGNMTLAEATERLDAIARDDRECSFAFGLTQLHDAKRVIETLGTTALPGGRLDPDADIPFSHTGLLHHRSLFDAFGLFDADFQSAGDYEFMLRAARDQRTRFHHIGTPVARMAAGGMSNSVTGRARHYREMQVARAKLGMEVPRWLRRASLRAQGLGLIGRLLPKRQVISIANIYRGVRGKPRRQSI